MARRITAGGPSIQPARSPSRPYAFVRLLVVMTFGPACTHDAVRWSKRHSRYTSSTSSSPPTRAMIAAISTSVPESIRAPDGLCRFVTIASRVRRETSRRKRSRSIDVAVPEAPLESPDRMAQHARDLQQRFVGGPLDDHLGSRRAPVERRGAGQPVRQARAARHREHLILAHPVPRGDRLAERCKPVADGQLRHKVGRAEAQQRRRAVVDPAAGEVHRHRWHRLRPRDVRELRRLHRTTCA